jgi:hypothetical protein
MNVLFLDGHVKAASREERQEFRDYTINADNPYRSAGKP